MITEIESAIIARIQSAHDAGVLGYGLKKIGTWGGDNTDDLRNFVKDFPAIWVIYAGERPGRHTSQNQEQIARFNIIVAAQSLRNEAEARRGAGARVGTYQMIKDCKALILNQTLGLDITPIKPVGVTPLLNEQAGQHLASLYGLEVETRYNDDQIGDTSDLDIFETFHANWDVPVFGNVGPELPDDDNADATDHVTLSEE